MFSIKVDTKIGGCTRFFPMKFFITLSRDGDGMVIAECPAIPGCVSQGSTEAEAAKNVGDAFGNVSRREEKRICP